MFHKKFSTLSYDASMRLLRTLAYGGSADRRAMRKLAAQAIATAPTEAERRHAERWANAFRRGHRIKVGTYVAKFYAEGITPEIEQAVEDVFTKEPES